MRNSNYRRTVISILLTKRFLGLVVMTFGLENASSSLPEWQAVKMTLCTLLGTPDFTGSEHWAPKHSLVIRRLTKTTEICPSSHTAAKGRQGPNKELG